MKKINIYWASKFECKLLIQSVINDFNHRLPKWDVMSTSEWAPSTEALTIPECAKLDYGCIDNSDMVVGVAPFLGGANSELGYALGKGIKTFYLIDKIFFTGEYKPRWGEQFPLPCGLLAHPYQQYDRDEEGNGKNFYYDHAMLEKNDKGCIVHSLDDLVNVVKFYFK